MKKLFLFIFIFTSVLYAETTLNTLNSTTIRDDGTPIPTRYDAYTNGDRKMDRVLSEQINEDPADPERITNTWDGLVNAFWANPGNWSLNHPPTVSEDVIIPDTGQIINLVLADGVCNNLMIDPDVILVIWDKTLTVNGTLSFYGNLTINDGGIVNTSGDCNIYYEGSLEMVSGSELNCASDIWFTSGSVENVSGGEIYLEGDFKNNDVFTPTGGTVIFDGNSNSYIMGSTTFYDLNVNRTGAAVYLASDINILNDLQIDNGTFDTNGHTVDIQYNVYNYGTLYVDDNLDIGNDLFLYSGSVVDLSGTIQLGTLDGNHGSAIHFSGSTFNQTSGYYYVESIRLYNGSQFNGSDGATHLYVDGFSNDNTIEIDDPDSYFYDFVIYSGTNAELYDCDYDLRSNNLELEAPLDVNSFEIFATSILILENGELIIDAGGIVQTEVGTTIDDSGKLTMVTALFLTTDQ